MKRIVNSLWIILSIILISNNLRAQVITDTRPGEEELLTGGIISSLLPSLTPREVIVTFKGSGPVTSLNLNILKQLGINNGVVFRSFPIVGVLATTDQINQLRRNSSVRSVYPNKRLKYFNERSTELTGVDRLRQDPAIIAKNGGEPVTGKGIGVLINDSGVDGTHSDIRFSDHLVQNVLASLNPQSVVGFLPQVYLENIPNTDSNSGHGTHVTGIVGGTGELSGVKYEGVAPGAHLIGFGSGAVLFILDALGGLDYAATHQQEYGIRVVSNSWGSTGPFDPNDPINVATKRLYDQGIINVFAGGNEGPGQNTMNPYSLAPWVISVAAGDANRNLAGFSSRGVNDGKKQFEMDGELWTSENRPTVTAPGVDIVSTKTISPLPLLSTLKDINNLDPSHLPYYTHMSGTSMAAPHVSGIIALMLEANPSLSPSAIKDIIQSTAVHMPGYALWEAGAGYVDAYQAVDHAFSTRQSNGVTNSFVGTSSPVDAVIDDLISKSRSETTYSINSYPNPFTYTTFINYTIPHDANVTMAIFDMNGNKITTLVNEYQVKGSHQVNFEEAGLKPGIYIVKIKAGQYLNMIKMIAE